MRTPPCRAAAVAKESRLLDRHGEPGDQPRNLIEMLGIMRFNGLREPKQAFVVAHGGNVAWDDRRYRAYQVCRNGWHRISSHETRHDRAFWAIKSNWRPGPSHLCMTELHRPGSNSRYPEGENDDKSLSRRGFLARLQASAQPVIWSFAIPKGFVIRSPLANLCFACSSVAQR